jgi:uncharacterized Zn finger protein (UPF0148 family)
MDRAAQECVAEHPDGMTLEEIGEAMHITRERVRQIEAKALTKLRTLEGDGVIFAEGFAISIPDCRGCNAPFIRMKGDDRYCELCDEERKIKREERLAEERRRSLARNKPREVRPTQLGSAKVLENPPLRDPPNDTSRGTPLGPIAGEVRVEQRVQTIEVEDSASVHDQKSS